MVEYKLQVKDGSGNVLGEFEKFKDLKFSKRLNNYGTASFSIPVNEPKAESLIALRIYSVWIYRNGTLIWSGEQAMRKGHLDDKGDNWVSIYCYTWFEQLFSRYTASQRTFTGVDAGEIAWTLIDETQDESTFGFTEGTIEATMDRDREYPNQNIGEAIVNLSNVLHGFDFEINDVKGFQVYARQGVDRTNLIFEYGYNITSLDIQEDFVHPVNRAIVLGDSGNPTEPLRVERDDVSLQGIYKLRESLSNEMQVVEVATLEEKGDAILRKYGTRLFRTTMDLVRSSFPTIEDFALGDLITLKVKSGVYDIEEAFRIYEWAIDYNEDDTEKLDLVLGNFIIQEFS